MDSAWRNEEHEDVQIPENLGYVIKSEVENGPSLSFFLLHSYPLSKDMWVGINSPEAGITGLY